MAHTEFGRKILDRVAEQLEEISVIENQPKLEGRTMAMVLSPKPEVLKKTRDAKVAKLAQEQKEKDKEREKEKAKEDDAPEEQIDIAEDTENA